MSPQQNKEYLRSLLRKRHRISGASGMRVFRQKDGKHGGCVSSSPEGKMSPQRQMGVIKKADKVCYLFSERLAPPHQRSAARRVFRQKDGSRKAVYPLPLRGRCRLSDRWGS